MGALGDSFYEYLLKEWLRSGKRDTVAKVMLKKRCKICSFSRVSNPDSRLIRFGGSKSKRA